MKKRIFTMIAIIILGAGLLKPALASTEATFSYEGENKHQRINDSLYFWEDWPEGFDENFVSHNFEPLSSGTYEEKYLHQKLLNMTIIAIYLELDSPFRDDAMQHEEWDRLLALCKKGKPMLTMNDDITYERLEWSFQKNNGEYYTDGNMRATVKFRIRDDKEAVSFSFKEVTFYYVLENGYAYLTDIVFEEELTNETPMPEKSVQDKDEEEENIPIVPQTTNPSPPSENPPVDRTPYEATGAGVAATALLYNHFKKRRKKIGKSMLSDLHKDGTAEAVINLTPRENLSQWGKTIHGKAAPTLALMNGSTEAYHAMRDTAINRQAITDEERQKAVEDIRVNGFIAGGSAIVGGYLGAKAGAAATVIVVGTMGFAATPVMVACGTVAGGVVIGTAVKESVWALKDSPIIDKPIRTAMQAYEKYIGWPRIN